MRLYQRERSPYWWMEFTIDGKKIRASTQRPLKDKAGAQRVMAQQYEKAMNRSQFGEKPEITIREAMQRTVESVKGSTRVSYDLSMRRLLGDGDFASIWSLTGHRPLSSLTDEDVEDLVKARRREGIRDNSILIEIRFLKRVNNLCAGRFTVNRDLCYPKIAPYMKTRFLTDQEEVAILKRLEAKKGSPSYDKALCLFIFLLDTGVRLGEALSLDWSDVDMPRRLVTIYRQKTKVLSLVPISDRLLVILKSLSKQRQPFEGMTRAVKLLRKIIDLECNGNARVVAQRGSATIHSLRDTFASRLAARGMSLHKLAKLLGHTSPKMTVKYSHLEVADVVEEARRLMSG